MTAARTLHWNGKDLPDELRDLPPGTYLLQSVEALAEGGDDLDDEERAALDREIEASFDEEAAGQLIDISDAMAELRMIGEGQARSSCIATSADYHSLVAKESARR